MSNSPPIEKLGDTGSQMIPAMFRLLRMLLA